MYDDDYRDPYSHDVPDREARKWAMFCHLAALSGLVGIPGFIVQLIIWLAKRDEHPFIDRQGREALNFQISMWIYIAVTSIVMVILLFIVIGFLLIPVVVIMGLIDVALPIYAGIKANDGEDYRYPMTIRFL
ncbi:MAG: DUF4870 domain-containing protein [Candidatus Hydrogenedentota bacterium]